EAVVGLAAAVVPDGLAERRELVDREATDARHERLGGRVVYRGADQLRSGLGRLADAVRGAAVTGGGEDRLALRGHLLEDRRLVDVVAERLADAPRDADRLGSVVRGDPLQDVERARHVV